MDQPSIVNLFYVYELYYFNMKYFKFLVAKNFISHIVYELKVQQYNIREIIVYVKNCPFQIL